MLHPPTPDRKGEILWKYKYASFGQACINISGKNDAAPQSGTLMYDIATSTQLVTDTLHQGWRQAGKGQGVGIPRR